MPTKVVPPHLAPISKGDNREISRAQLPNRMAVLAWTRTTKVHSRESLAVYWLTMLRKSRKSRLHRREPIRKLSQKEENALGNEESHHKDIHIPMIVIFLYTVPFQHSVVHVIPSYIYLDVN